jgi:hypothetical protein
MLYGDTRGDGIILALAEPEITLARYRVVPARRERRTDETGDEFKYTLCGVTSSDGAAGDRAVRRTDDPADRCR